MLHLSQKYTIPIPIPILVAVNPSTNLFHSSMPLATNTRDSPDGRPQFPPILQYHQYHHTTNTINATKPQIPPITNTTNTSIATSTKERANMANRSLRALRAPTFSWRPFGPFDFVLCALRALRLCVPRVVDWIAC